MVWNYGGNQCGRGSPRHKPCPVHFSPHGLESSCLIALHERLADYYIHLVKNLYGFFSRLDAMDVNPAISVINVMSHPLEEARTRVFQRHFAHVERIRHQYFSLKRIVDVPSTKMAAPLHGLTERALYFASGIELWYAFSGLSVSIYELKSYLFHVGE